MHQDFTRYAEELKPILGAAVGAEVSRLTGATPSGPPDPVRLLSGGKHLRGALLCLIAGALGGTLEAALPRACALELIHTATLIHDDIVDQHRERRGLPALWTLVGARRAVLLGDVIFSSALHQMGELGREDGLIASRAIAEVSWGAYREPLTPSEVLSSLKSAPPAAGYQKIIHLKTGVLFGAACQLGALAAGAGEVERGGWLRWGLQVGEAYQVADDLQDVEQTLLKRVLVPGELAQLAPALLHFRGECRPWLLETLEGETKSLSAQSEQQLQAVAGAMRGDVERRLERSQEEIARLLPGGGELAPVARSVPRDLIRIFDLSESQAFSQLSGQPCRSSRTGS